MWSWCLRHASPYLIPKCNPPSKTCHHHRHGRQLRLILEYCDGGSLEDALKESAFFDGKPTVMRCDETYPSSSFLGHLLLPLLDRLSFSFLTDKGLNYAAILETAADVAKGMLHLHVHNVIHADLKAGNVMFKSGGEDGRGYMAKLVDFGLSVHMVGFFIL